MGRSRELFVWPSEQGVGEGGGGEDEQVRRTCTPVGMKGLNWGTGHSSITAALPPTHSHVSEAAAQQQSRTANPPSLHPSPPSLLHSGTSYGCGGLPKQVRLKPHNPSHRPPEWESSPRGRELPFGQQHGMPDHTIINPPHPSSLFILSQCRRTSASRRLAAPLSTYYQSRNELAYASLLLHPDANPTGDSAMRLRDRRDLNRTLLQHKSAIPRTTRIPSTALFPPPPPPPPPKHATAISNRPTTTEHAPTRSPPRMPSPVKLRRIQTPSPGASYGTRMSSPLEPRPSSSALMTTPSPPIFALANALHIIGRDSA